MKFYVYEETDPNDPDAAWQSAARQGNAYSAYLASVRERLPEPLWYIAERINFGDYLLEELDIDLESSTVTLRIGARRSRFYPRRRRSAFGSAA
jgi:hypothetical protein